MDLLTKTGRFNVIGLEGDNRVGGRVYTTDDGDEFGAAWIHGIESLDKKETNPVQVKADSVGCEYFATEEMRAVSSDGEPLKCSSDLWLRMWTVLDRIKHGEEVKKHAYEPTDESVFDYIRKHFKTLFEDIPPEHQLAVLKAVREWQSYYAGIWDNLSIGSMAVDEEFQGEQRLITNGGYGRILNAYYEDIITQGGDIRLKQIVTEIDYNDNDVDIHVKDSDEIIHADVVVVTVSLGVLKSGSIKFNPELPAYKQASINKLGFGVYDKIIVEFEDPIEYSKRGFWPDDAHLVLVVHYENDDYDDATTYSESGRSSRSSQSPDVSAFCLTQSSSELSIEDLSFVNEFELPQSGTNDVRATEKSLELQSPEPNEDKVPNSTTANVEFIDGKSNENEAKFIKSPRPYNSRDSSHIGIEMVNLSAVAKKPKLVMLIYDKAAVEVETFASDKKRLAEYAKHKLTNAFPDLTIPKITDVKATTWGSNPLTLGSFANIPIGASGMDMKNLAIPVDDRLFFAGEATFPKHYSTVHGAMKSGRREFARLMRLFFPNEPCEFADLLEEENPLNEKKSINIPHEDQLRQEVHLNDNTGI